MATNNEIVVGDNLNLLRTLKAENNPYIDLIYTDPPFNSNRDYLVQLDEGLVRQRAYDDQWNYTQKTRDDYEEIVLRSPPDRPIVKYLAAMHELLVSSNPRLLTFLIHMAPRVELMHALLKETGSLFLHCDEVANSYLRLLLDTVFGAENRRSEIIWKCSGSNNNARKPGVVHDTIFFYSKSATYKYNQVYLPHTKNQDLLDRDEDGRAWWVENMTGPGARNGPSGQPWRGHSPHKLTPRNWAVTANVATEYTRITGRTLSGTSQDKLDALDSVNLIVWKIEDGVRIKPLGFKHYMDHSKGIPISDIWVDIGGVSPRSKEFQNFETQKPIALAQRIIRMATDPGDQVVDPYVGSGTTAVAAALLGRNFIGMEIDGAVKQMAEARVQQEVGDVVHRTSTLINHPTDMKSFLASASQDRFGAQTWGIRSILGGVPNSRLGKDGGLDGNLLLRGFLDKTAKNVIVEFKSGGVSLVAVRAFCSSRRQKNMGRDGQEDDLNGKAIIGLLLCSRNEITAEMRAHASREGEFVQVVDGIEQRYRRIQLLALEDFFEGVKLAGANLPGVVVVPDYALSPEAILRREKRTEELESRAQMDFVNDFFT